MNVRFGSAGLPEYGKTKHGDGSGVAKCQKLGVNLQFLFFQDMEKENMGTVPPLQIANIWASAKAILLLQSGNNLKNATREPSPRCILLKIGKTQQENRPLVSQGNRSLVLSMKAIDFDSSYR